MSEQIFKYMISLFMNQKKEIVISNQREEFLIIISMKSTEYSEQKC